MKNKKLIPKKVQIGTVTLNNQGPLTLIAGPCVMESEEHLLFMAASLKRLTQSLGLKFIFKCSYDKANRTSHSTYRGFGLKEGLRLLEEVKKKYDLPVLTDVHEINDVAAVSRVADVLQIPAFLCRQTDLVRACAQTGKTVNIKKGQFLSPWEMSNIIKKILDCGNKNILLTERGTSFGYNNLVVDMRGLEIMKRSGFPVVFDATHSVQLPGKSGNASGGQREFVEPLAKAATAIGIAALFMEVHPDPDHALSDGPNSVKLKNLKKLLQSLLAIDKTVKK